MGGKGRAINPTQNFVFSLASCIAVFIANFCRMRSIDSKDLKVTLDYDKLDNSLGNFKAKIHLPNFPEEKRKVLLKVAEHCTVHESIVNFKGIEFGFE